MSSKITSLAVVLLLAACLLWISTDNVHCQEKGPLNKSDTTGYVKSATIEAQLAEKQKHFKDVQDEITRIDAYKKALDNELTGTAYQIQVLNTLKASADSVAAANKKKR